ncbi:MAG: tetraacyldisaccharide 4'-kinase [Flavobacteriales bacterium]|nr:tetraacyldisaccharide 4'-kinase [Flavobacteriales bacterium]
MKILLLPFSGIFWIITTSRNLLYNWNILPSKSFATKNIVIGNLSTGGTGKSPMTMYLVDLLKDKGLVAVLSRGYKRKTRGFRVASYNTTEKEVGDEPMQFFNRFKNKIIVSVCESRVFGIKKLIEYYNPKIILLDDAYQHRKFKSDFNILLTDYENPYYEDYLLPAGNLRESKLFSNRANIIVVTKCPSSITEKEKEEIKTRLKPKPNQSVYFSSIVYSDKIHSSKHFISSNQFKDIDVLLVTGIAKSDNLEKYCALQFNSVLHKKFPDHYRYIQEDITSIRSEFEKISSRKKIILTTEKDFMRLSGYESIDNNLFFIPIEVEIDKKEEFNTQILNYAQKNSSNS